MLTVLFYPESNDMNVRCFMIIPQVPELLFFLYSVYFLSVVQNRHDFTVFFLMWMTFISFSGLTSLARTSNT